MKYQNVHPQRLIAQQRLDAGREENAGSKDQGGRITSELLDERIVKEAKKTRASSIAASVKENTRLAAGLHSAQLEIPTAVSLAVDSLDPRRFTGVFVTQDFTGILVGFEGSTTKYDWGEYLDKVNANPYQQYFRTQQISQDVIPEGIDPANIRYQRWGYVVMSVQCLKYTKRFGGSFQIRLLPTESYGIEISDSENNLFVDLHDWALNLYIQPMITLFNNPAIAYNTIVNKMFAEIHVLNSEVYKRVGNNRFEPHDSASETDVANLIANSANESIQRLRPLGLFALGFVHEKHMTSFEAVGQAVTDIYVSDNLCQFATRQKIPHVQVLMETMYLGTGNLEGPFDDDAEVTAEPWVILRRASGLVVMSNERHKYIGSGASTGWMTMGYISLEEASVVKEVTAFASLTEHDPVEDDYESSFGFVFDVDFDLNDLQNRAAANNLGLIGQELYDIQEDSSVENLFYTVRIKFNLVKF